MINILLPSMGKNEFFKDSYFPKPLTEINGKTMMELVVDNYRNLVGGNYIFIFKKEDCIRFHLDESAKLLADNTTVIRLAHDTLGALCTSLMAVEYIDNENELIIANSDQIIDVDYKEVLDNFRNSGVNAGVITFQDIHPRWSYVIKDGEEIVKVAEKNPISKSAVAGFYYFKSGSLFVEAAKTAILKQNNHEGSYYISASINEMILKGYRIGYYEIEKNKYKSFYSPSKIREYEEGLR